MTRGSPTPVTIVEQVKASAALDGSVAETARKIGIPYQTASDIITNDDKFIEFRDEMQKEYILSTWKNIKAISQGLEDHIASGKLKRSGLTEFTRALKDLKSSMENVVNNINIDNRSINVYNTEDIEAGAKAFVLENREKVREWLGQEL